MVAGKAELTQKDTDTATQAVLAAITNALSNEEKYRLLELVHLKFVKDLHVLAVIQKQVKKCKSLHLRHLLLKTEKN